MGILHLVGAKVWGGGEQYVYNVCQEEQRRGRRVFVVVDHRQTAMAQKYAAVATVYPASLSSILGLAALQALRQYIIEQEITVINCHSGQLAFLCALLKKFCPSLRFIMFRHNLLPNKTDCYHLWLQRQIDAFICVSQAVYALQLATIHPSVRQKVWLVHSGIDTTAFDKYSRARFAHSGYVLGYAGRLIGNKGVLVLLEALETLLKTHGEFTLQLAGTADKGFMPVLVAYLQEHHLEERVQLLGLQNDMEAFYKAIDVLILPSLVPEAFGLVICEALYCATPVITTNSGAQEEIITQGKNGLIVPPGEVKALCQAIEKLYTDQAFSIKLVAEGEKTVKTKFTISQCVTGIEQVVATCRKVKEQS
ncbi:MAG: glycosyltransferase family 4 protein [Acidaminococcaceae bacterium]